MPLPSHRSNLGLLRKRLRNARLNGGRIAVVGVGSDLRGDDAAGMLAAGLVRSARFRCRARFIRVFMGGTTPENITGQIVRLAPSLIVILDAADMGLRPGAVRVIPVDEAGGISCSTHAMPLSVLSRYLGQSAGCDVVIVGIQPATTDWNAPVTPAIKAAAARVAGLLASSIVR